MKQLQLQREAIYEQAAQGINADKVLLVCDRGIMDSKAYLSELEFSTVLNAIKKNEVELRDNYDAVFHLVTAANGAEEFYTLENNAARTETIEEAREVGLIGIISGMFNNVSSGIVIVIVFSFIIALIVKPKG